MTRTPTTLLAGAAMALALSTTAFAEDPELVVLEWAGFDHQPLIEGYVEKNGAMPTYSIFADEDEAFQKMQSGFAADIGHPCSKQVVKYRDAGLIEPWDTSRIPEFANINPLYLSSPVHSDDQGVWFIPTDYAFTALAYNTEQVPEADAQSLQIFVNPAYQGKTSLPTNTDDAWSLALLATGVTDWSNVTEEQFQAAAAWLRQAHLNVRTYWNDPSELASLMKSGEVTVAFTWNDGVAAAKREGVPVAFNRAAQEGAATWFCGYVNFANGPGSEDKAYDFINAFLEHRTAPALLEQFGYAMTNTAAMAEIPAEALAEAFVDPVTTTLLAQTPISPEMSNRMLEEFEAIKAGF
jgi:spermidine/putrescine transport system substrate-binding protein